MFLGHLIFLRKSLIFLEEKAAVFGLTLFGQGQLSTCHHLFDLIIIKGSVACTSNFLI